LYKQNTKKPIDKFKKIDYNNYRKKKERTKKMTRTEIEKRIENLKEERFFLAMKDFWNREDFKKDDQLKAEIKELKKALDN
jgi:hypothetical protein